MPVPVLVLVLATDLLRRVHEEELCTVRTDLKVPPPPPPLAGWLAGWHLRVRGEMMGSGKYEIVGKSQPILMMINPILSPPAAVLWLTLAVVRGW
eukprot:SAG25_NODE_283_length_10420_cov_9.898382_2_plen_95_part_00